MSYISLLNGSISAVGDFYNYEFSNPGDEN